MSEDLIQIAQSLARMGDDRRLLVNLFRIYLDDAPKKMAALDAAWAEGNLAAVERLAHSLKGASSTVGASAVHEAALLVEQATKEGDRTKAQSAYLRLQQVVAQTLAAMVAFCETIEANG
jgi:HPt (histidine-containing phosphotransfer) domain-containing protein